MLAFGYKTLQVISYVKVGYLQYTDTVHDVKQTQKGMCHTIAERSMQSYLNTKGEMFEFI